jgi:hypothetical protein
MRDLDNRFLALLIIIALCICLYLVVVLQMTQRRLDKVEARLEAHMSYVPPGVKHHEARKGGTDGD